MKKGFRIAATVVLLLAMLATVVLSLWLCIPQPGTDTADIDWKLGVTFVRGFAVLALLWEPMVYGCVMYFLVDRQKWNILLTVLVALLLLLLLAAPLAYFL